MVLPTASYNLGGPGPQLAIMVQSKKRGGNRHPVLFSPQSFLGASHWPVGNRRVWSPGSLGQPQGGIGQGKEGAWMWGQGRCVWGETAQWVENEDPTWPWNQSPLRSTSEASGCALPMGHLSGDTDSTWQVLSWSLDPIISSVSGNCQ